MIKKYLLLNPDGEGGGGAGGAGAAPIPAGAGPGASGGTPPPAEGPATSASAADNFMASLTQLEKDGVGQDGGKGAPGGAAPAPAPAAKPPEQKKPEGGAPDKPAEKKPDAAPPKPAAQPAPKPAAAAKPDAPLDWKTAPVQFREAHTKLLQVHEAYKAETEGKLAAIETEKAELLKRRFWTPEEEQRFKDLTTHSQRLEAQVYSMDYKLSPEFKQKYEDRQKKVVENLKANLADLKVKNEDGTERAATFADFKKIMTGATLVDQRRIAKQIFGEDADIMLKFATDLRTIEDEANSEITTRLQTYTTDREKNMRTSAEEMEKGRTHFATSDQMIAQKYPGVMSEDPNDPEFSAALKQGLEYFDNLGRTFSTQTTQQRAFNTALSRRMAAGFIASRITIAKRDAEITRLNDVIKQLQGSDPGAGGDGGGGQQAGGNKGPGGSDSLAEQLDNIGA